MDPYTVGGVLTSRAKVLPLPVPREQLQLSGQQTKILSEYDLGQCCWLGQLVRPVVWLQLFLVPSRLNHLALPTHSTTAAHPEPWLSGPCCFLPYLYPALRGSVIYQGVCDSN